MKCPICYTDKHLISISDSVENDDTKKLGKRFSLILCVFCRIGFTHPFPSNNDLNILYDIDYGSYNLKTESSFSQLIKYYFAKLRFIKSDNLIFNMICFIANTIARFVELLTGRQTPYTLGIPLQFAPNDNILEIGYGTGNWLCMMKRHGYNNIYGFDISNFMQDKLKNLGITTFCGDIKILSDMNIRFDLVRLQHVFEHIADPREFLLGLVDIIKPKGTIVIVVPNIESITFKLFGIYFSHLAIPHHLFHYSPSSLESLFKDSGYTIESVKTLGQSSIFMDSLVNYLNCNGNLLSLILRSKIVQILMSPLIGLFGYAGMGDEITLIARRLGRDSLK